MGIQNSPQFMKLYLVHCGFYDEEVSEGIYEFHVNLPVIAESLDATTQIDPIPYRDL